MYKIAKAIPINVHIITTKIFAVAKFHNTYCIDIFLMNNNFFPSQTAAIAS